MKPLTYAIAGATGFTAGVATWLIPLWALAWVWATVAQQVFGASA